jgi:hypothetical protein
MIRKIAVAVGAILAANIVWLVGSPANAGSPGIPAENSATSQVTSSSAASVNLSSPPPTCPIGYLCLYDLPNYGSTHPSGPLKLYTCGDYSLERWNYIHGGSWRDKAQSIFNNQTGGVDSRFYDTRNGTRVWVGSLENPPDGFPTLSSNANQRIDFVHVC